MTTRGLGVEDAARVAGWIADVIENRENEAVVARVAAQVHELCAAHPVYPADLLAALGG
jgi:glycine hydroxymethyltransferase